jgi:anaerobic selenocysteine-containing dehydrogenase
MFRTVIQTVRTACAHDCPDQCSLLATVDDGRLLKLQGDPDHPMTAGFACAKVNREHEWVHSPDRVLTPLRRAGAKGEGRFEPISWAQALDEIVGRWQAIISSCWACSTRSVLRGCGPGPSATPAPRRAGTRRAAAPAGPIRRP